MSVRRRDASMMSPASRADYDGRWTRLTCAADEIGMLDAGAPPARVRAGLQDGLLTPLRLLPPVSTFPTTRQARA